MNNLIRCISVLSLVFGLCLFTIPAEAQVFPGDVNNNGTVNNLDVLSIGYAYGSYGPGRPETLPGPGVTSIPILWDEFFPQGLNYAFADADGSGLIDLLDVAVVFANYGGNNEDATEEVYFYEGTPDVHTPIILDKSEVPPFLTGGSEIEIPVYLGSEEIPVENFTGIAFTIDYQTDIIASIQFIPNNNTEAWINQEDGSFGFIAPEFQQGEKDVAISRFAGNPVSGYGEIGKLSLIVIDDIISLLPAADDSTNTIITIKDIKMVNDGFWSVPVVTDSVNLMIYGPEALPTFTNNPLLEDVNIYPNPMTNFVAVSSPVPLRKVEIFSSLGDIKFSQIIEGQYEWQKNDLNQFPPGLYLMKIHTEKGIIKKKILVTGD